MFHLSIATAEQSIYEGDIESLVAPAVDGEVGILTGHHPLVTKLGPGKMHIIKADKSDQDLFVTGGYLEVSNNNAIILADVVEDIDTITAEQAREARTKAQDLLKNAKDDVERDALQKELQIQMVRERFAAMGKYSRRGGGTRGGQEDIKFEQGQ
jgi:F-type H+-transporting ATPase subunit epsilon